MRTAGHMQTVATAFEARCRTYYRAQDRGVYYTGMVPQDLHKKFPNGIGYLYQGPGHPFEMGHVFHKKA